MNATRDGTILQDRTKLSLNGDARLLADIQPVPAAAQVKGSARHAKNESREEMPFSGPLSVPSSSGFAWAAAQRPQEDRALARSRTRSSSRGQFPAEADRDCTRTQATAESAAGHRELPSSRDMPRVGSKVREPEPHDAAKRAVLRKWSQLERPDSFDSCDTYHSQNFSHAMLVGGGALSSKNSFEVRRVDRLFTCYYGFLCVCVFLRRSWLVMCGLWNFRAVMVMVRRRRPSTRGLCCPSRTRSTSCCRRTSAISGRLFERHGSGEVTVFLFLFSFFFPSLLLDSLIVWEWLYGHRRKKGGQVRKSLTISFHGRACDA